MFFFFKQKTAYDMRISDWSSDVCTSDLAQEPEETVEVLRGNLNDTKDARERDDDEPVEGVSIFVRSAAGEDIDSAESDADGRWEIERSEERRVGKEGVRTCRSRWSREN